MSADLNWTLSYDLRDGGWTLIMMVSPQRGGIPVNTLAIKLVMNHTRL